MRSLRLGHNAMTSSRAHRERWCVRGAIYLGQAAQQLGLPPGNEDRDDEDSCSPEALVLTIVLCPCACCLCDSFMAGSGEGVSKGAHAVCLMKEPCG